MTDDSTEDIIEDPTKDITVAPTEDKPQRWYNSDFFGDIGRGIGIALVIAGIGFAYRISSSPETRQAEIELNRATSRTTEVYRADLNGNGIPDKFYVIDGNLAVVELDGKPVVKSLDSKVEE